MLQLVHQTIGLAILFVAFAKWVHSKTDWLIALAVLYALGSALWLYGNPVEVWSEDLQVTVKSATGELLTWRNKLQARIDMSAAITTIHILMVTWAAVAMDRITRWRVIHCITILVWLNCFFVLFNGWGIFNARSPDCTMIAILYPFMVHVAPKKEKAAAFVWLAFPLFTILVTKGVTAYVILAAEVFVYMLLQRRYLWAILSAATVIGVGAGVAGFLEPGRFWFVGDRVNAWKMFLEWWMEEASWTFGTGTGSLEWLAYKIQKTPGDTGFFTIMHNEYIQVLFEQGIIGVVLFGAVWIRGLKRSLEKPWLFLSMVGSSVAMASQFPLRFFLSQITFALLIMESEDK